MKYLTILCAFFLLIWARPDTTAHQSIQEPSPTSAPCPGSDTSDSTTALYDHGCTVVYATDGEIALGGNNEDHNNPLANIWFVPGENGEYGRAYVGFDNYFAQGGVNDQGLFYDGMAVSPQVTVEQGDREYAGIRLVDQIMRECATVACVIDMFDRYHLTDVWAHQFLFGDATGDSAIIEPNAIVRIEGNYQVGTNYFQSKTAPEESTCWRFKAATEILENASEISLDLMREVMDAAHTYQGSVTMYTTIYNLTAGDIYLYYFHDYDNVIVFDLEEELTQGAHGYNIPALFPDNTVAQAWAAPILTRAERVIAANTDPSVDPDIYDDYAGAYQNPDISGSLHVVRDGDRLWLQMPGPRQYELLPRSETEFFYITLVGSEFDILFDVNFVVDEEGQPTGFDLVYGGAATRYEWVSSPEQAAPLVLIAPTAGPPTPTPEPPEPSATPEAPPTIEVLPTATATAAPAVTAVDTPPDAQASTVSPLWWIAGAAGAVILFSVVLVLIRRKARG